MLGGYCKPSIAGLKFRPWCRSCFLSSTRKSSAESLPTKPVKWRTCKRAISSYKNLCYRIRLSIWYRLYWVLESCWGILARSRRLCDRETYVELDKNLVLNHILLRFWSSTILNCYCISLFSSRASSNLHFKTDLGSENWLGAGLKSVVRS